MKKKVKIIFIILIVLLVLVALLSGGFLIYNKYIKEDSIIKVSGNLSINYLNGDKLNINKSKDISIKIINDSTDVIYYNVEFNNVKNADNVTYKITNNDDINIEEELNNYNSVVASLIEIDGGETETLNISFDAKDSIRYSLEVNVSVENTNENTFEEIILKNNKVNELKTTLGSVSTINEGLIKGTDEKGDAYFFRGNVTNNNVKIGDLNFKIVKINGDGSVKLVYDGVIDGKRYYEDINNYSFAASPIAIYLNTWFSQYLISYQKYIANYKYCNDIIYNDGIFNAYNRISVDNIPSYVCISEKYSSKIGMLTADEVIYAGGSVNAENKDYYLYNADITLDSFLMTSAKIEDGVYYPYMLSSNGQVISNIPGSSYKGVRPVITIIKTAEVTGSGTVNDPYIFV